MPNGGRRLASSQRTARSVSFRPSSSIWICTVVSTWPSRASTWAQKSGIRYTSLATSQARVMSGIDAPVSSACRNSELIPDRSIMSLTTTVVMTSRCSRCGGIRSANRSRIGAGK
jgi:hypothetical protein